MNKAEFDQFQEFILFVLEFGGYGNDFGRFKNDLLTFADVVINPHHYPEIRENLS